MKRVIHAFLSLACVIACAFGLAACNSRGGETHTHAWSAEWQSDETHHWHNCTAEGCTVTDNSQKSGYAAHDFTNGDCVCGKQKPSGHQHDFTGWVSDNDDTHTGSCDCGETSTVSHSYGAWTAVDGSTHSRTCPLCSHTQTAPHVVENGTCTQCSYKVPPATIASIANGTVDNDHLTVFLLAEKTVETLNLSNTVTLYGNGSWKLYTADNAEIPTKRVSPADGDNTYLIVVTEGNDSKTYEFTVHKSHAVNVVYKGVYGETLKTEPVDSGYSFAVDYAPAITGYTFNHWEKDGEEITTLLPYDDVTLTADCTANEYAVSLDVNGGDALEASSKTVTFDSDYVMPVPARKGYAFLGWCVGAEKMTDEKGQSLNGSKFTEGAVLRADWQIKQFTVTAQADHADCTVTGGGTYDYGTTVRLTATPSKAYAFSGWFNGTEKLTEERDYSFTLDDKNVSYTAKYELRAGMEIFNFTSDETTCRITGLKDKTVTVITIPDCVTSIGSSAFIGCSGIKSVTVGNGVTSIGDYVFRNCRSLTSITIGTGVTSIGSQVFLDCIGLTSVTIPNNVTSIGSCAFSGCSGLESITIPFVGGSVNSGSTAVSYLFGYNFGTSAFEGGTEIEQYYYDNSSFKCYMPTSLKSVTVTGGNISNGAFSGCTTLTSIALPNTVESFGNYAFRNCSSLTSITIPDGVTKIGGCAFQGCSSLTGINIPSNVASIGDSAFSACSSLASITVEEENAKYHSAENCLIETASKTLLAGCKNSTIPTDGSVTKIRFGAFSGYSSLASITIPESVTEIETYAFLGCSSLASITFNGTMAQWSTIKKFGAWDSGTGNYTVHCTDGDVAKH